MLITQTQKIPIISSLTRYDLFKTIFLCYIIIYLSRRISERLSVETCLALILYCNISFNIVNCSSQILKGFYLKSQILKGPEEVGAQRVPPNFYF